MKTQFSLKDFLELTEIRNELELERALIADRKLRVLAKENPEYKKVRKQLRDLIEVYENKNWSSSSRISDKKILESDFAEFIAEQERIFIENRKALIRKKLKNVGLNQKELGSILGHRSKSYMSELMNGISPFTLKDLVIINQLLKIDLTDLVPTFLPHDERIKIKSKIEKLEKPKLKIANEEDFALVS
jgi:antitoxin component HigA of HigAB toxin-antitoxin module